MPQNVITPGPSTHTVAHKLQGSVGRTYTRTLAHTSCNNN